MNDKKLMLETTLRDAFRLAFLEYPRDKIKIEEDAEKGLVSATLIAPAKETQSRGLWLSLDDVDGWYVKGYPCPVITSDRWVAALRLASILRQRSLNPDYDYYFEGLRKGSGDQQQQQQESDRNAETKTATQPEATQPGAQSKDNGQG